jgi:hypothetical protein
VRSGNEEWTGGDKAGHWKQALAVELWGIELGTLEAIREPLLSAAGQLPVGTIAAGHSRVALGFGAAAEAADALEEDGRSESHRSQLRDRLWELGAVCTAVRACLAALGAEDEPLAAACVTRALVVEMGEATSAGGLLRCKVEPGPALIAHMGGFMGPLAVGGALICEAAHSHSGCGVPEDGRFAEGERLIAAALVGLGDHAVDAALRLGLQLRA